MRAACEGQLDELDAPTYALLVHSLGCMGHVPPRAWLDELLESAASLMHDFSPEVRAVKPPRARAACGGARS